MKNLPARWTAQGWSGIASVTEPAARIDFFCDSLFVAIV